MARVVPGGDCRELQLGDRGPILRRNRDGAFHVADSIAKQVAQAAGGFIAGTRIGGEGSSTPSGPWCPHDKRPFYCDECKETL